MIPFLLLGTIHLLWQGYDFAGSNHAIQIPILKSYFHPDLYPGDAVVATRSHYITFYFIFFAVLERVFGHLELLLFGAHLLTEVLIFVATYQLAYAIFNDRRTAIIALFMMFPGKILLGAGLIHWNYHTHTFAVLPLILWAFTFFIKDRTRSAYALLGFSANINIQAVAFVFPMFALVSLLRMRRRNEDAKWYPAIQWVLKDYGIFALCAAPCIIWALATGSGEITEAFLEQLRARSTHHSFPFSWDKKAYMNYLLLCTLGLVAWSLALKRTNNRQIHLMFAQFGLVVLLLCGLGVVFAEWIPVKLVLRIQPFRSTKFLTIFIMLYAGNAIRYLWGSKSVAQRFLAISTFLILFFPPYFSFLTLLLVLYLLIEGKNLHWWVMLSAVSVLVLRIYVPHVELANNINFNAILGFLQPLFEDELRLLIIGMFLLWLLFKGAPFRWAYQLGVGAILLVMFLHVLPATYHRMVKPIEQRSSWVQMQAWVKDNVPNEAMFITPPYLTGFRIFSERGTLVEWKDGTQQYFDLDYSDEWWQRLRDIGRDRSEYDNLSPEQLIQLGKKYKASYVVFAPQKLLPFQQIYQNSDYRVYVLP